MDGENVKEITTPWECQLKVIHGSSLNDEESLTPQDRMQLVPKQHYVHRNSEIVALNYGLLHHKSKLNVKIRQDMQRRTIPDLGQAQKC